MALYSPVVRSQENIARTLKSGLAGIGQSDIDQAEIGLRRAGLEHQIGRQKKADERADRSLGIREEQLGMAKEMQEHTIGMQNLQEERAAQQAMNAQWLFNKNKPVVMNAYKQAQLQGKNLDQMIDLRNQPLNGKGMAMFYLGPNASRETVTDFLANGKLDQIMKATGAKAEIIDGELRYRKRNGKVATWWDMPKISPIANDILMSGVDPVLKGKQRIREYEKLMAQGGGTPEQHESYLTLKKNIDNPNWQIAAYEKLQDVDFQKRDAYKKRGMDTSTFETNIARRTAKMGEIKATVTASAVQAGKERIAKINAAGKLIGTLEKDSRFLSEVTGLSVDEATDIIRNDKTLAQSIRGAAEELKLIDDLDYDTPEALAAKVAEIKKSWGLDPVSLKQRREAKPKTNEDPDNIRDLLLQ